MKTTTTVSILRYTQDRFVELEDAVVTEVSLSIVLNGVKIAEILCSPFDIRELITGFLFSEKRIDRKEDIGTMDLDTEKWTVSVETGTKTFTGVMPRHVRLITPGDLSSGNPEATTLAPGHSTGKSKISISAADVHAIGKQVHSRSKIFKKTGGAHSAAVWNGKEMMFFREDIGRHNALDKIIGRCLLDHIDTHDKTIVTSGRISSAVLGKIVHAGFPVLVSRSAPTDRAVQLSDKYGITMIGFARRSDFNIYSNAWRVRE